MAAVIFDDFDLTHFWSNSAYALEKYVEERFSRELLISIEQELGYKLPAAYIELMETQNGGIPANTCFPTGEPTSWAKDHIAITGISGIGYTKPYSLRGKLGSQFMLDEWGYPPIGVCVCDCPSAGHDMVMLDYSACGPQGEPTVVHVDQEDDYISTFLAPDFESFIRGLVNEEQYDTSAEDLQKDLARIEHGSLSPLLTELIARQPTLDFETIIRKICHQLATEKGFFALHADEVSLLLYDVQFLLYSQTHPVTSEADYLAAYPNIIALAKSEFSTGGYAPGFVKDWLASRRAAGKIIIPAGSLAFSEAYERALRQQLLQYCQPASDTIVLPK
ncbi:SMI1/KNR4 family protein [Hymenobacter psoromatis]|uniref:SMI1/KNR4 family protein n=1 Tax=Hymenobacter psoromatis TaxID=1484116 RepID=UPI001CBAF03C|nr:SMI1/KNR4 family protein [Hymenobacter psoromatis]